MAGKLSMTQLIIIQLVGWLGWPSGIALAQLEFGEAITGSVSITAMGMTFLINAAVFVTSFLRRRLYLEMGARDVMATRTGLTNLKKLSDGDGVSTYYYTENSGNGDNCASVVMLSRDLPNSSVELFMKYMCDTHDVYSILLQGISVETAVKAAPSETAGAAAAAASSSIGVVRCRNNDDHHCNCIVFSTKEDKIKALVARIPELKQLTGDHCLLQCSKCLSKVCHVRNQELFDLDVCAPAMDDNNNLIDCAVCEALDFEFNNQGNQEAPICMCIPLNKPEGDAWTKVLMKSLMSKDVVDRGAINKACVALGNYLSVSGIKEERVEYYGTSTFIVPRLIEILINFVLTVWLKLDGFSSALVARRSVRNHIVDSTGNAFAAHAFLTAVLVKYDGETVCQKLRFRGGTTLVTLKTLSFTVGLVNLICSLGWALSIALGARAPKWCRITWMPLSIPRLAVLMAAICIGLGMDYFDLRSRYNNVTKKRCILVLAMILEIMLGAIMLCIMLGAIKGFGRWVYSALQILVWVKWGIGCYLLGEYSPQYAHTSLDTDNYSTGWWDDVGPMVYSSSFLLNAGLALTQVWGVN